MVATQTLLGEFIENGEELKPLQERIARIKSLSKYSPVELQQFQIDLGGKRLNLRCTRQKSVTKTLENTRNSASI